MGKFYLLHLGSESSGAQWEPLWVQATLEASVWERKWNFRLQLSDFLSVQLQLICCLCVCVFALSHSVCPFVCGTMLVMCMLHVCESVLALAS